MTDILNKDKKIHIFDLTCMFTDKLGDTELPPPPPPHTHTQMNIKIKENPKLFAIYTTLEIKIKAMQDFVCYPMHEG